MYSRDNGSFEAQDFNKVTANNQADLMLQST